MRPTRQRLDPHRVARRHVRQRLVHHVDMASPHCAFNAVAHAGRAAGPAIQQQAEQYAAESAGQRGQQHAACRLRRRVQIARICRGTECAHRHAKHNPRQDQQ